MNPELCSGRTLAFLGDAVWSLYVRRYLIEKGEGRGKTLQRLSVSYVSAKAQCRFYEALHENNFFDEEEEGWFRRGRNGFTGSVPKHTDVQIYKISTGFEALLGGLELAGKEERIKEIFDTVITMEEAQ
ncbi:MAG: ribonuclease III domain-containing protein [Lactimicrobium sp.]|jgi:ribonuclease-3 family protein|uniref:Mini-ribonuclease 3 n=1 Tax=Lactimicrobium sp. TaxID=2563780 RepID=UPI002F353057